MSDEKIILYDIPSKGRSACWSPNVWKTRAVLNYKKIPYTTVWLAHPEIQGKLSAIGIPPAATGSPYTLPAIQFPDKTGLMDSAAIAPKLEELYPEPSLHLETGLQDIAQGLIGKMAGPLVPVFMPPIGLTVLVDTGLEEWVAAKEKVFGMSLQELRRTKGGESAWEAAAPGLEAVKEFLHAHKKDEGPFVLGSQPSYADFILASMIESCRRVEQGIFDRIVAYDASIAKFHQACSQWYKEDQ